MNQYENSYGNIQEIVDLVRKQAELEGQLERLKQTLHEVEESNKEAITKIHKRIENIESEMVLLRASIENIVASVDRVQKTVNDVYTKVGSIDAKQDTTITAQDKFISQLWKAFFSILGVIVAGGTAAIAFLK